jgi:arylsulfatase A-like enzyme
MGRDMQTALANFSWGAGWGIRAFAAVFAVEIVAIALDGVSFGATPGETACGILMAAFVAGVGAVVAGLSLGVLVAFAAGAERADLLLERKWASAKQTLTSTSAAIGRTFLARLFAAVLLLAAGAAGSIPAARAVAAEIQTPLYAAILTVASAIAGLAASTLLWPVWRRAGHLVAGAIRAYPPWRALLGLAAGLALISAASIWLTWDGLASFVPWRAPLSTAGTLLLIAVWVAIRRSRPAGAVRRRTLRVAGLLLLAAGTITAFAIPDSYRRAGYLVEDAHGPLSPAYSLIASIADLDGDLRLSILGGGDCAPGDPEIHPGAWDRPDDGIDQDCDGEDSRLADLVKPGRHDYPARPHPRPMPVILVTIDAVSALRMELHGADRETMPNLTRRAAGGAVFEWAFSEGPATRLSFPSLLSGLHASQIGRQQSRRTTVPWTNVEHTIASVFAGAGYPTVAVSPDKYFAGPVRWLYKGFQVVDDSQARAGAGHEKNAADITRVALEQLDRLADERRFFLWVHYTDAHYPHRLPPGTGPDFGGTEADIYDRELLYLDEHLEPFLAGIEQRLRGRDHVVALTADHGQAFDSKHQKWHQDHDVSTAVTWVPMIFWSPWSEGRRIERLANIIDVMPTLLNMAGLEADGIAGDSLLPSIAGQPDSGRPVMQQFFLPEYEIQGKDPLVRVAVRQGRHVLHQIRRTGSEELYDFKGDPLETIDLLEQLPDVARRLRGARDGTLTWAYPDPPHAGSTGNDE